MRSARSRPPSAREAIIDAATELIRVHGVAGTSISEVIAASGTSAGAIYHHFGSKERLLLEVGRSAMAGPMSMILQTGTDLSPMDLLAAALRQVAKDRRTPELMLQIWAGAKADPELAQLLQTEIGTVRASILARLRSWCEANAAHAEPDGLVSILMALVAGFAVQRALIPDLVPGTYLELATRMLRLHLDAAQPAATP